MREIVKSSDGVPHFIYPSVWDLTHQPLEPKSEPVYMRSIEGNGHGEEWFGVPNAKAVLQAFEKGWPEGTAKMRDALGQIELPRLPSVRRKKRWAGQGDEVDIHRVYSGRVDNAWRETYRPVSLASSGSHLTIAVDISAHSGVSADRMMWRGAAAVAIAEAARESGRSVRMLAVWGTRCVTGKTDMAYFSCELKAYHQDVSTDLLMTFASLPGFYRVAAFRGLCSIPDEETHGHLGFPHDFDRKLLADGSKMVWIGKDNLSVDAARRSVKAAAQMMVNRLGDDLNSYVK